MKISIKLLLSALAAGCAIGISGIAFLSTGNAWTFPIGLFIICAFGLHLFTGKIPYAKLSLRNSLDLFWMIIFNILAAVGIGIIVHYTYPVLSQKALELVVVKLNEQWYVIPRAILCNIMIFVAVHTWRKLPSPNNLVGLIFATAIFVMCGFEHCIANAFYFGCAMVFNFEVFKFIFLNIIGNMIGGLISYHTIKYVNPEMG